tara:strand:- start:21 stop:275 length:255 start_codon:yes stop_codon:yes gene_type:complete
VPTYEYFCQACQKKFSHRMSYKEYRNSTLMCDSCDSELTKVMSISKNSIKIDKTIKTGQVTKNSIEEFKQDLENQKKELREKNK